MRNKIVATVVAIAIITAAFSLLLTPTEQASYIYEIEFEDFMLQLHSHRIDGACCKKNFHSVSIEECFNDGEIGKPSLPFYGANFVIPLNCMVTDVSVSGDYTIINMDYRLLPQQPDVICNETAPFAYNKSAYNQDKWYGTDIVTNTDIGFLKGYKILSVNIKPIEYNPVQKQLRFRQKVCVKINVEAIDVLVSQCPRNNAKDISYVKGIVDNPETISLHDVPMSGDNWEYIIICNHTHEAAWQPLKQHRENYSGLTCKIVTDQWIYSTFTNNDTHSNDQAGKIREFCRFAYNNWNTQYVLIGGDWGPQNNYKTVAARDFEITGFYYTYDWLPSDIYFSNLDNDFYDSANGVFGGTSGDHLDRFAELHVGRICVSNESNVANAIHKIIEYDNVPDSDPWLKHLTFAGGDLGWTATSKQYMEALRLGGGCYPDYVGFEEWNATQPIITLNTSNRIYHADVGISYNAMFSNSIESDDSSVINHLSHSGWNSPFGLTVWSHRYNTRPFFGWSQGCLAGRFTAGFAGSEQLQCRHHDRHAFAVVLNTGYGLGSSASTCGKSQRQHQIFWHYFFDEHPNEPEEWELGKAHTYQKDTWSNYAYHSYSLYVWFSSCYFGDPAQQLRFPVDFQIHNISLEPGYHTVNWYGNYTTTLRNISEWNLKQNAPEWVGIYNITKGDYDIWIANVSPDYFDKVVNPMDELIITIIGTTKYLNS